MSRLTLAVHAWDVMDRVFITVDVREYPHDAEQESRPALTFQTTIPGEGVTDPQEWLRDVLVGLLEAT